MSRLHIFDELDSTLSEDFLRYDSIREQLRRANIVFERWSADQPLSHNATQDEILQAYQTSVRKLMSERGYATADVISVNPDTPNHAEVRKKFLDEHTHSEDEARFFVEGCGLFYLHISKRVYALLCEQSDLIVVPAGTRHWFDMGPRPQLKVIRTFTTPEGWVADFTGSPIASRFPRFENLVCLAAV